MIESLECPVCDDGQMQEVVTYATKCCGAPVDEPETDFCPVCGREEPAVAESERYYQCTSCGHTE
jgi:rRNA maturation endonuclease Nob1